VCEVCSTLALDGDVVLKSDVADLNVAEGPFAVQLDLLCLILLLRLFFFSLHK
jgi:hypothetical protein